MEKVGPFIGYPASGGQGVTWSRAHLLEGAGLSGSSPRDLHLPQGPHLTCACVYVCVCVCVCVYACPGGLVTPRTSVCHTVLTSLRHACVHAHTLVRACVCARAQDFFPFFLLLRDVAASQGLCLHREWGRGLVLPTNSPQVPRKE